VRAEKNDKTATYSSEQNILKKYGIPLISW
jgi:hypothetical protein